jgi:hypothetical protein
LNLLFSDAGAKGEESKWNSIFDDFQQAAVLNYMEEQDWACHC